MQYFANVTCILLVVDWRSLRRWWRRRREGEATDGAPEETAWPRDQRAHRLAMAGGTAFGVLLLAVALFQIEWWPFTKVDMYASYTTATVDASRPRSDYRQRDQVVTMAQICLRDGCTRQRRRAIARICGMRLEAAGREALPLPEGIGASDSKYWRRMVLSPAVVDTLGAPQTEAPSPADAVAAKAARIAPRYLDETWDRVVIVCRFDVGEVVIGAAAIPAG